jgi:hypothetical protein
MRPYKHWPCAPAAAGGATMKKGSLSCPFELRRGSLQNE